MEVEKEEDRERLLKEAAKRRYLLWRKYNISFEMFKGRSYVCEFSKRIEPQPRSYLDVDIAKRAIRNQEAEKGDANGNRTLPVPIRIGVADVSKPGEPDFSEKAYFWSANEKIDESDKTLFARIDDLSEIFVAKVEKLEELYRDYRCQVIQKLSEKTETQPSIVDRILK